MDISTLHQHIGHRQTVSLHTHMPRRGGEQMLQVRMRTLKTGANASCSTLLRSRALRRSSGAVHSIRSSSWRKMVNAQALGPMERIKSTKSRRNTQVGSHPSCSSLCRILHQSETVQDLTSALEYINTRDVDSLTCLQHDAQQPMTRNGVSRTHHAPPQNMV